eukprot:XP_025005879.1 uncharacterized protein LOC107053201 [Gallus gallus]
MRNRTWETSFCLHYYLCGNSVTTMLSHIKPTNIFPRKDYNLKSKCCSNSRPLPLSPAPRPSCFMQGWRAESLKLSKGRECPSYTNEHLIACKASQGTENCPGEREKLYSDGGGRGK